METLLATSIILVFVLLLFVSLWYVHESLMREIKELYRQNDKLKREIEEVKKTLGFIS